MSVNVYFSDFFNIDAKVVEEYEAFDVSLINDFPLFIDPFLLFNSSKEEYQGLHEGMIKYLKFLRDKAQAKKISPGLCFLKSSKIGSAFQRVEMVAMV
jgi:hypothetical protein